MARKALFAAVAVLLAGTANAAVTEFVIYRDANFRGGSHTVKGEVANLEGGFARAASSLVVRGGYWEVCDRDHFKGDCRVLGPGEYPSLGPDLRNRIVSVRFVGTDAKVARRDAREERREDRREAREERREERRDAREERREWRRYGQGAVELYGRQDFRGRSILVESSEPDLGDQRFDGRASSAIVREGTWQLCSEPGYAGRCAVLRPGEYRYLAGLDDRVSSVRRVR